MSIELARLSTTAMMSIQVLQWTTELASVFAPVMSRSAPPTSLSTVAVRLFESEAFSPNSRAAFAVKSSSLLRNTGMLSLPLTKGRSRPINSTISGCNFGSSCKVKRSNSRNDC